MSDPEGGLPSGVDPCDPGALNDSSLGADRAEAIEAEKKKWREHERKRSTRTPAPAGDEPDDTPGAA
jgi:hypothetical protein